MRACVLGPILFLAMLFPIVGNAQVYPPRAAPPEVTAAAAGWQINGESVVVNSSVYVPTRAMRLFDGQVMAQVGVYQGVPLYADVTIEPNSIIYVPVGGARMRAYERRRSRELAGTAGSIVPNAVGSSSVVIPRPRRTVVETVPPPRSTRGVWLDFAGARWYSAGRSTSYSPDRFMKVGEYRGFPVYIETAGKKDRIWVQVVTDGPLAPYLLR
jgi:hypothetical protein